MKRRDVLAGICSIGVLKSALAEEQIAEGLSSKRRKSIAEATERFLTQTGVPGLSLAYARAGAMVYVAAFGFADHTGGLKATTVHRFRIASVSKPITATAILMLAERGKLSLDHRILNKMGLLAKDFPLAASAPHRDWLQEITIDHLLTHTVGGWGSNRNDPMFWDRRIGQADLIRSVLSSVPLEQRPGTRYSYSNFGYCLLGKVIEAATGQGYEEFVRANVLGPADAGTMEIGGSTARDRREHEVSYLGRGSEDPYGMNVARMDSHGGWIATAVDLVNFGLRVDGYRSVKDILSKSSSELSARPTTAFSGYARGWAVSPNHRNRWHAGSLPGTTSILVRTEGGVCFAGLANGRQSGGADTVAALDQLMWEIHAKLFD